MNGSILIAKSACTVVSNTWHKLAQIPALLCLVCRGCPWDLTLSRPGSAAVRLGLKSAPQLVQSVRSMAGNWQLHALANHLDLTVTHHFLQNETESPHRFLSNDNLMGLELAIKKTGGETAVFTIFNRSCTGQTSALSSYFTSLWQTRLSYGATQCSFLARIPAQLHC